MQTCHSTCRLQFTVLFECKINLSLYCTGPAFSVGWLVVLRIYVALNPSQTYVATALRPLRDWQFTPIAEVATRSPIGPGEVAEKSATDRGPRCDQISRGQVFGACTKTWLRLIWSQTGPGKVADQSPIGRRLVADRSPTNFVRIGAWLSLKLVGDWSAIGRRPIGDLSATSLQLVGDLSRNLI